MSLIGNELVQVLAVSQTGNIAATSEFTTTGAIAGLGDNATNVFPVSGKTDAAIRAAVTQAIANGGGTVFLPAGTYALTAPLPVVTGLSYNGVAPIVSYNTVDVPDGGFELIGGTILQGDGTFNCFAANNTVIAPLNGTISAATNTSPIVLTVAATNVGGGLGIVTGQTITVSGVGGNTAANNTWNNIIVTNGGTTITLNGSTGNGAYTSGGTVFPDSYANNSIQQFGISNIGLNNFLNGIYIGEMNNIGLAYSSFYNVWITNCPQWGFRLANFLHCNFNLLRSAFNGTNGVGGGSGRFSAYCDNTILEPGNSIFYDMYTYPLASKNTHRWVFDALGSTGPCGLNSLDIIKLQCNDFNTGAIISQTATLNSTTAIVVTDATQFVVGQPVQFTTTADGFAAYQAYFVLSVNTGTNTLTVGSMRAGTAITATGSGTITILSDGFPQVEFIGQGISGNYNLGTIIQCKLDFADLEGSSSGGGLSAQNLQGCDFNYFTAMTNANEPTTVLRACANSRFTDFGTNNSAGLDADAASATSWYEGLVKTIYQRSMRGLQDNLSRGVSGFNITAGNQGPLFYDMEHRSPSGGGIISFSASMIGQQYKYDTHQGTSGTPYSILPGSMGNTIVASQNTGPAFWKFATIVNDSTPNNSTLGINTLIIPEFQPLNLQTDGTQTFNNIAGCTTAYIPVGSCACVSSVIDSIAGTMWWQVALFGSASLGGTPTVAAGAAAASATIAGTNRSGVITFTGQSGATAGALGTVSFVGSPYGVAPTIRFSPASAAASSCQPYVSAISTSGFTLTANVATVSGSASIVYHYEVMP